MTKVAGLSESNAGLVMLIGQLSDALGTLATGYLCDKTKITWYGKRKFWHGIGTLAGVIAFPFVFNTCINCNGSGEKIKLAYYLAFSIMFGSGWAATQIAHLFLIPEITSKESQRVELNAIRLPLPRSGFTFACGIFIYGATWLLLGTADGNMIDPSVSKQFTVGGNFMLRTYILVFIVIGTGLVFCFIFHVGTKEKRYVQTLKGKIDKLSVEISGSENAVEIVVGKEEKSITWKAWLKHSQFYKVALMYVTARLAISVFQSYFALYLTDALHLKKEAIAYFPLIVLMAGSITTFFIKFVTKKIGGQWTYTLGALMIVGSSIWLFIVDKKHTKSVYGAAWLAGSGNSVILVTSLANMAELIGTNKVATMTSDFVLFLLTVLISNIL
ncbi:major facilitator superfamily domain-containing protein 12-like [Hydractinia symbiolongicarpus]|uniref:major facilitator superfamily domain-containing protein 12-like n=1 Tax=Hydractinia symbiolongicarpus TaxID=13093 RepID=UPI00254D2C6D|nr:major facilitator superfamily domain-containing protein 12-like [Hydractinia symbiolongicarpus]